MGFEKFIGNGRSVPVDTGSANSGVRKPEYDTIQNYTNPPRPTYAVINGNVVPVGEAKKWDLDRTI